MRKFQPLPFYKSQIQNFFTQKQSNMPLVVPGINSDMGSDKNEWLSKLVGKKISDSTSDVTVRLLRRRIYPSIIEFFVPVTR
ncbi:hypothetical protein V6Z88_010036 [Aspergillus fumigatus]